jgi:hypothetical protein
MTVIYLWPTWLIISAELAVCVGLSLLGHVIVRRTIHYSHLEKHNDVVGFVLAIMGVVYAVLLAFVVVIAWEQFNTAERIAQDEVSAAFNLYELVATFKTPLRDDLRREILHYADLMQTDEWPAMQTGGESSAARNSAERISNLTVAMIEADAGHHATVESAVMDQARAFIDARQARLEQNVEGIPSSLWTGLILGAVVTIAFTYLFGVKNFRTQLVMTGLLAAVIAIMFSMIVALDYPYRGDTSVTPERWKVMEGRISALHPGVKLHQGRYAAQ